MKSQTFPETIPANFASNETLSQAYRTGWNFGHGIACHNVPTLGDKVLSDSLGRVTVNAENIREVHESACHEAASNKRQYSPFEHTAHGINALGEGGWFVFDPDNNPVNANVPFETEEDAKAHVAKVAESEENAEGFTVKEYPSSEETWEAFEQGSSDAIGADLATYTDADYGISAEDGPDRG